MATTIPTREKLHVEAIEALAGAGVQVVTPQALRRVRGRHPYLAEVGAGARSGLRLHRMRRVGVLIPTWMARQFPDEVPEEVFATPDTRICGTLNPLDRRP
ncbi:hypothetical protein QRX60_50935 [Amycolatopsis mongoliensis]|uniref:Uncharacterized protein n=1 Tax=Amycolatopsis mongoliensis TaxID=715475 RepID=A0A9Y2JPC0_9PSEU|nr:hypothetical protein [Amycolatopsis sp. 4-36]WIY02210.1 hypothetical protein QRX60_50935 [Amycolatopsis sp. 4-36]